MSDYIEIVDFQDLTKMRCVYNGQIIDISNYCKVNKYDNDKMYELVSVISGIPLQNININALRCKIVRVKQIESSKRGPYLIAFKNEQFHVPTCTVSSTSKAKTTSDISQMVIGSLGDELAQTQNELDKQTVKLEEMRTKVKNLQNKLNH